VGVVAQVHDLTAAQGEDRKQLPVELYPGEFLPGVVADALYDVVCVREELECVHVGRLTGSRSEPGEHLLSPLAGDIPPRVV
jgi:hypothetical protein